MSKRKNPNIEQSMKKQKTEPQLKSPDSVNITKRHQLSLKENIPWPESDIHELLSKIEESIPKDDTVSYSCRLEKLNWERIAFKSYSIQECKEVWNTLQKAVRKFRFFGEILNDVRDIMAKPKIVMTSLKPKQPPNNFFFFREEKRQEVLNENPTLKVAELSKQLGVMFKNLPPEEREKYDNKAKIARQEYSVKLQEFYEKYPELTPKKTKPRRKSVEIEEGQGLPKKPKTPFELFVQVESEREEVEVSRAVLQKYRDRWYHELSDKEKFFWINWADEMYTKYLEDLKEYIKVHPDYEPDKIRYFLTKNEKKIKERCAGRPDKPPHGPYQLFSKMILNSEEAKKINKKDLLNYIAEQWHTCSAEEKREYKTRVEQLWEDYHKKLEEYLSTLPPEERDRVREEDSRKKVKPEKKKPTVVAEPTVKLTRPLPPAKNVYKYFEQKYKGDETPEIVWRNMQADEKLKLKKAFDEAKKTYLIEFEHYLKSLNKEELQKLRSSLTAHNDNLSCSESSAEEEEEEEEDEIEDEMVEEEEEDY